MEIQDIQRVIETFIERLQLPESNYSLTTNTDNTFVEFNIALGDELQYCLSIDNGSLRVLYGKDYTSETYYTQTFNSPISLLYQLCVIFFVAVGKQSEMTFNDLLTVILLDEITNWKELAVALAENLGLQAHTENNKVIIEGVTITYDDWIGRITFGENEFEIDKDGYTNLVEAIFSIVEYLANINDKADSLFDESNNVIEEPEPPVEDDEPQMNIPAGDFEEPNMGGLSDVDMDSLLEDDEDTEPVEPVENTDFSEPIGPVITPDDVQ